MRGTSVVVFAALVGFGCAPKLPPTYELDAKAVPYQGYAATYPSGLRLVAYQLPQADRFMVATSFASGATHDPAGQEGLAHVVEHLVYRARPSGADQPRVDEWLAASGWRWNAETSPAATTFWETGKPAELATALGLEAARLRDPLAGVTESDFAQELSVVLNEHRERVRDDAWGTALGELLAAAFPGDGRGHLVGGTEEALRRLTLQAARAWAAQRYIPARALVVVVSPLAPQEVAALVLREFGEAALGGGVAVPPAIEPAAPLAPRPAADAPRVVRAPIERPRVWVAWPVPGMLAPGTPHVAVVTGELESRVRREVARNWLADDVHGVEAGFVDLGDSGLVWAGAEVRDEKVAAKMTKAMREAMREHRDTFGMISVDYRREVLDRVLLREYLDMEELDAREIADFVRATGNTDFIAERPRRTYLQLHTQGGEYANRWLTPEQGIAVLALPNQSVSGAAVVASAGADRIDPLEDEGSSVRVPGAGAVLAVAAAPGLHAAERRELANGLRVVVARRGRHGVAEVRLVVRTDVEGGARVPRFAPALAVAHGAGDHTVSRVERLGASAEVRWAPEHVTFRVRGSSTTLKTLIAGTAGYATRLSFDEPAVERTRIAVKRGLDWYRETPTTRAWALLRAGLFGDHPYGADETVDALLAVKPSAAGDWLRDQLRPQRATLIVVSDEPATPELWETIEKEFGGWRRGGPELEAVAAPAMPERRRVILVDRPGASQALLLVGVRSGPPAACDAAATEAVRWLLESRVNRRLRAEDGVAYGAGARLVENDLGGALVLRVNVDGASTARSLTTVLEAAAALAREKPDAAAAARARWQLARRFAFRFDRVEGSASALEETALRERDDDAWELWPSSIAALTPARIQGAAQALGIGREVVVVVGDAAALEAPLRAAGFSVEKDGTQPRL